MKRIHSEDAFRRALHEERARASRGSGRVCLAIFDLGERRPAAQQSLEQVLGRLLRETDEAGWIGDKQIGVLLRGTPPHEARRVAQRLHRDALVFAAPPVVRELAASLPRGGRGAPRTPRRITTLPREGAPPIAVHPAGVLALLARPLPRWKRALDVALAGAALVLLSPLLAAVALAVRIDSAGPVIYRQQRTGQGLRRFWIYKFRTMRPGADRELGALAHVNEMSGPLFKSDADPRVSRVGRVLRRTSLDELPQLVNVLRGDMTLFGPRALSPVPSDYEPWQLRRFTVRPGLACEWQASHRGDTDFVAWMRNDLGYVAAGPSPRRDVGLFFRTLVAVLTCTGGR